MAQRSTQTGWVGWAYFASAMLVAVGAMQAIAGLAGLFRDNFYVVTATHLVAFNYTAWGWINLVLGLLLVLTGLSLWTGAMWARVVAVVLAVLSLVSHVAFLNAYPLWSIIGVVIDGLVIYALTMHGSELRE